MNATADSGIEGGENRPHRMGGSLARWVGGGKEGLRKGMKQQVAAVQLLWPMARWLSEGPRFAGARRPSI